MSHDRVGPPEDPDRYILIEHYGLAGGEGEIWRAHRADEVAESDHPPRPYAIKLLTPRTGLDAVSDLGERWMRSVSFLKGMSERIDGLCYVYEGFEGETRHSAGEHGATTTVYLVMEWVTGVNYDTFLTTHPGKIAPLLDTARALDALHRAGFVHGDVKPANIKIMEEQGRAAQSKLVDISLLRQVKAEGTTLIVGTPGYVDPSLLPGTPYTPLSDLYSFAAMLSYAIVGESDLRVGPAPSIDVLLAASDRPGVARILGALNPDPSLRERAAGYEVGQLETWLNAVIADPPQLRPRAPTARHPRPRPEPATVQQASAFRQFFDDIALAVLEPRIFALAAGGVILFGLIVGLILGSMLTA